MRWKFITVIPQTSSTNHSNLIFLIAFFVLLKEIFFSFFVNSWFWKRFFMVYQHQPSRNWEKKFNHNLGKRNKECLVMVICREWRVVSSLSTQINEETTSHTEMMPLWYLVNKSQTYWFPAVGLKGFTFSMNLYQYIIISLLSYKLGLSIAGLGEGRKWRLVLCSHLEGEGQI